MQAHNVCMYTLREYCHKGFETEEKKTDMLLFHWFDMAYFHAAKQAESFMHS